MDFSAQLDHLLSVNGLISLFTLIVLEIVLGIDNIIFISIIAGKVEDIKDRKRARTIGLMMALAIRVLLLFGINWIIGLTTPLITLDWMMDAFVSMGMEHPEEAVKFTGRDLILLCGGIFLLAKTTSEIHEKVETTDDEEGESKKKKAATVLSVIIQITLIDIVFSFDSILTAVGIVNEVVIMIVAVVVAMLIMLAFSESVSNFIDKHPTIKMLALAFLLMIGLLLILESFDVHVPKPYVYCSMAFAFLVELLNMRVRKGSTKKGAATKKEPKN